MKKIMNICFVFIFVFSLFLLPGCAKANPQAEKAAIEVSQKWLSLLNEKKYGESWDESAKIFQSAITREDWEQALNGLLTPFGKVLSRELKSAKFYTTLPGAPDGEYVVIQYKTSFENKKSTIETITPMLDKDGQWRVSGYYIK